MEQREHYRADGVRITHDPFHPAMEAKYGRPGETDKEVGDGVTCVTYLTCEITMQCVHKDYVGTSTALCNERTKK